MNQVIQKGNSHYGAEIKEIVHSKTNESEGNSCTSSTAQNGHDLSELFCKESPLCVNCNDSLNNVEDLLENLSEDDTCVCIECYFSLHFPFLVPKYELLKMSNVQRNYRYSYNFKLVAQDFHEDDCIVGLIIENSDLVNVFQKQQQNSPSFLLNASLNKDGVSIEGRNNFRIRSNRIKYIENTIRFECLNLSRAASTSVSQNLLNPNQQANIRESQTQISIVLYHAKEIKISEYIHDTFNKQFWKIIEYESYFQILNTQFQKLKFQDSQSHMLKNETSSQNNLYLRIKQFHERFPFMYNQIDVSKMSEFALIKFPVSSIHHQDQVFDLQDYCEINSIDQNPGWLCPICDSHKIFLKELQPDYSLYCLIQSRFLGNSKMKLQTIKNKLKLGQKTIKDSGIQNDSNLKEVKNSFNLRIQAEKPSKSKSSSDENLKQKCQVKMVKSSSGYSQSSTKQKLETDQHFGKQLIDIQKANSFSRETILANQILPQKNQSTSYSHKYNLYSYPISASQNIQPVHQNARTNLPGERFANKVKLDCGKINDSLNKHSQQTCKDFENYFDTYLIESNMDIEDEGNRNSHKQIYISLLDDNQNESFIVEEKKEQQTNQVDSEESIPNIVNTLEELNQLSFADFEKRLRKNSDSRFSNWFERSYLRSPLEIQKLLNGEKSHKIKMFSCFEDFLLQLNQTKEKQYSKIIWKIFDKNLISKHSIIFNYFGLQLIENKDYAQLKMSLLQNRSIRIFFEEFIVKLYKDQYLQNNQLNYPFFSEVEMIASKMVKNRSQQSMKQMLSQVDQTKEFTLKIVEIFFGIGIFVSIEAAEILKILENLCCKYILVMKKTKKSLEVLKDVLFQIFFGQLQHLCLLIQKATEASSHVIIE